MKLPVVVYFVNGDENSAMGVRARQFAVCLRLKYSITVVYRTIGKIASVRSMIAAILSNRPDLIHVFDLAFSGTLAGLFAKYRYRVPIIIDTGDAIYSLSKAMGRSLLGQWATGALEWCGQHGADHLIVRGEIHQQYLTTKNLQCSWIPDVVDLHQFQPEVIRQESDYIQIGVLGSATWNPKTQSCYGSELIEIIHQCQDLPVRGVLIGSGDGIDYLQKRVNELQLQDRIDFVGRVRYDDLPELLQSWDIAISTQTNDWPGQVRTTGKLPIYLSMGCMTVATRVGQASRILPADCLIDYQGSYDSTYIIRLAEHIRMLIQSGRYGYQPELRELAHLYFDVHLVAHRLAQIYDRWLG